MSSVPNEKLSPEEYLAREHYALEKSELLDGEIREMGGACFNHNVITGNLLTGIHTRREGRDWSVMASSMRVRAGQKAYFYPDVVAHRGAPELLVNVTDTLLNPVLVVEVLSPSFEGYERGAKFLEYQRIPTLQEIVFVSQVHPRAEIFRRKERTRWEYEPLFEIGASLTLASIGIEIPLEEIYRDVDFNRIPPRGR